MQEEHESIARYVDWAMRENGLQFRTSRILVVIIGPFAWKSHVEKIKMAKFETPCIKE